MTQMDMQSRINERMPDRMTEAGQAAPPGFVAIGRQIWARKLFILGVALVFAVLGILGAVRGEDTFTSEVTLLLEQNTAELTNSLTRDAATFDDTRTAIQVFGSRRVLESVVDRLALDADPRFNPFLLPEEARPAVSMTARLRALLVSLTSGEPAAAADPEAAAPPVPQEDLVRQTVVTRLERLVSFQALPSGRLILVSVTTDDPEFSMRLANTVAEAFLDEVLRTRLQAIDGVVAQLGDRVVSLRQEVRDREQALQAFSNEVGALDVIAVEQQRASAAQLREQIARLEQQAAREAAELDRLDGVQGLSAEERDAAIAASALLTQLVADAGTADLAALREVLAQRNARTRQRLSDLQAGLAEREAQIAAQSADLLRLQQLEREVEASTEIYNFSVRRLNELSVQSGVERGGGRIVVPAEPPLFPDNRGLRRSAVVMAFLGLFLAMGWVLFKAATDKTLRMAGDVAQVLPGRRVVAVPAPAGRGFFGRGTGPAFLLPSTPSPDPFAEAVRRLRAALLLNGHPGTPLVVHMAADLSSRGKATLTLALARSFALLEKRVLVVDANMRGGGSMQALLAVEAPAASLQDVIAGSVVPDEAIMHDTRMEVDFLLATQSAQDPADLMLATAFSDVVGRAAQEYDVVLIDTAPLLAAPDAVMNVKWVTQTVLVASAGVSTSESLGDALAELPGRVDLVALLGADEALHRRNAGYKRKLARL